MPGSDLKLSQVSSALICSIDYKRDFVITHLHRTFSSIDKSVWEGENRGAWI